MKDRNLQIQKARLVLGRINKNKSTQITLKSESKVKVIQRQHQIKQYF